MDKRSFLAVVLSLAVLLIYQNFFVKPLAPKQPQQPAARKEMPSAAQSPEAKRNNGDRSAALQNALPPSGKENKKKDIRVETPLYTATFTTDGAALKSFRLKDYRSALDKKSNPVELITIENGMPAPLTVSFQDGGIVNPAGAVYEANVDTLTITKSAPKSGQLIFTCEYPGAVKIEKVFTFQPAKYSFDLEVRVLNLSANPLNQGLNLAWHQYVNPAVETDKYGHEGPVSFVAQKIDREEVKKLGAEKVIGPNASWAGFETKYFIASLVPQNPSLTSVAIAKDGKNMVSVTLKGTKSVIPPGQAGSFAYSLYLGPKDYSLLKAQGIGLEYAIDFGDWLKWLAMPMLIVLKFLYGYVHNYGIAIIILTTLIKIIFWPLGNKSYKSMKEMQKLQPKMNELKERYKNDKTRMSQETMALYKSHNVNPMGGCLPMLIQIPVFFGLYKTLLYAIELRHSPFFWWIKDLSEKDPYYITPLIMGATMFIQQKMTPSSADPMQAKVMLLMPVIFTFMFLNFPSGLVIYWLFNNVLSIGQQYYVNKS
jgi:YidC/Oxa1 family membrane protein insertase